ncbi:AAA family ATPase [Stigmatella aurantiaca]|uniref:ATP-binding protein, ClpX family n=1 Tax=Stigmatella aurantiaca (strain DW4/3-1) TaxID=378806 RepID=Q099D2_STIAD|nr:AAA family ATPase [Stigmatella aurantiaca]ADO75581.1 ATP-binding protein, ClpX family [Stigmatella aurantiaca DW4/3-1]EAU68370.1 ATP-dependent Clp protease ATP-binding subunit ClpX [Stigmatella aurantiaca DW4/3-1]
MPHRSGPEPLSPLPAEDVRQRVAELNVLSPKEIDGRLTQLGYRGQEEARRAAAVLAYRHVRRVRRLYLEGIPPEGAARENCLFLGPTGSGKTYLVELLFREILSVPTVMADATQFSETGYVGDDVNTLVSRLYEAAEGDVAWAGCGVICMDEFDKLATSRSDSRFAGQQTTKDVSGFGVQRSLLHLLSASEVDFPPDFGFTSRTRPLSIGMAGITFIACGAFSGLRSTAEGMTHAERLGFGREPQRREQEAIAERVTDAQLEQTTAFARYGFIPELIGRFNRIVSFAPLDAATLKDILQANVLRLYEQEFELEGLQLVVEPSVREWVVAGALKRETGARGLRAALAPVLEQAAYEHFGQHQASTLRLVLKDGLVTLIAE